MGRDEVGDLDSGVTRRGENQLKRALGTRDVVAIGLNGVIGVGIFLLPGEVASLLGPASITAYLLAALVCTLLVLTFAEVGSRFRGTGGPMIYAEAAFGPLAGFVVGWISWIVRVVSWAALAHGFVNTSAFLYAGVDDHRLLVVTGLVGGLTAINAVGVKLGAWITNIFTAAKLIPLALFATTACFFVEPTRFEPFAPHGLSAESIARATLIVIYAFVGFEVLTVPAGEMRNPERSVPRALIAVTTLVTSLYLLVWLGTTGTLATLETSENPVADSAATFLGQRGTLLIQLGIWFSVFGINAGSALVSPRCLYALSHVGLFPRVLGHVHPRTQTPVVAILVTGLLTLIVAYSGSFLELAVISVVARFAQYIPTCLALFVFRARDRSKDQSGIQIPGGKVVAALALLLSGWLLSEAKVSQLFWGGVALASGLVGYFVSRSTLSRPKFESDKTSRGRAS